MVAFAARTPAPNFILPVTPDQNVSLPSRRTLSAGSDLQRFLPQL